MQILFLHDNFPAQFGYIGNYLAENDWDVWFGTQRAGASHRNMKTFNYKPHRNVTKEIHPYVANFERAALSGQAVARSALSLQSKGLNPDIVVAHSGWGPGIYAKDIWPNARYVGYFEWYYRRNAPDVTFIDDVDNDLDKQLRTRSRNASIMMDLASCDLAICPTQFQKDQFPHCFASKMRVLHDGINTEIYQPDRRVKLKLPDLDLSHVDEIITYVARGMEPYRGFPEFMCALEIIQKKRPQTHAVIVGEDRVAYGKPLPEGQSFKKKMLEELDLDMSRTHFTGLLARDHYKMVLQASTVHTYLTIPFVLSWSMMEAMSAGCAMVCSDSAPVREMMSDGRHGLLTDMTEPALVAEKVIQLLDNPDMRHTLGEAARQAMLVHYAQKDALPKKMEIFQGLVNQ